MELVAKEDVLIAAVMFDGRVSVKLPLLELIVVEFDARANVKLFVVIVVVVFVVIVVVMFDVRANVKMHVSVECVVVPVAPSASVAWALLSKNCE